MEWRAVRTWRNERLAVTISVYMIRSGFTTACTLQSYITRTLYTSTREQAGTCLRWKKKKQSEGSRFSDVFTTPLVDVGFIETACIRLQVEGVIFLFFSPLAAEHSWTFQALDARYSPSGPLRCPGRSKTSHPASPTQLHVAREPTPSGFNRSRAMLFFHSPLLFDNSPHRRPLVTLPPQPSPQASVPFVAALPCSCAFRYRNRPFIRNLARTPVPPHPAPAPRPLYVRVLP